MGEIRFTDTTFRDGHASLWAEGMRTGMMLAVAKDLDEAGFTAVEVIGASHFKKCIRELHEDPWERIRLASKALSNTRLAAMSGSSAPATFGIAPYSIMKLHLDRLAANGIQRVHIMHASNDMGGRIIPAVRFAHEAGLEVVVALVFTESPRHTNEYYAQKAKEALAIGADLVYLKDPGGLMTPDRAKTIVPAILGALQGLPLEYHTHCTTGLGPVSVIAAVEAGVTTVHTAVPPLANGSSQPSVFNIAGNLRALGYETLIEEEPLKRASEVLHRIALQEKLPLGRPLEYDCNQYVHQVPGGVISNLRHQLRKMNMEQRLPAVLEESIRVRRDLGYPIMVTPYSQFVVSQATINVFSGERYKVVTDELIKYVLGFYGEEASGGVSNEARAIILDRPRADSLAEIQYPEPTLEEVRESFGGSGISDDELLLRFAVGGEGDVNAMREAGPFRDYSTDGRPLLELVKTLVKRKDLRHVTIQQPGLSLILEGRAIGDYAP
ncbi:MAG: hypothetical protein HKL84_01210 [Acidimicrobiaceae bacterium]|nr:hypothetical protein [Acidimicrobiaceae bacterium]